MFILKTTSCDIGLLVDRPVLYDGRKMILIIFVLAFVFGFMWKVFIVLTFPPTFRPVVSTHGKVF